MSLSRRRIVDLIADVSGVLILVLVVAVLDQRVRNALPSVTTASVGDVAGVSEDVNAVATVVALGATQLFKSQVLGHMYLAAFAATALVLVALLMRL